MKRYLSIIIALVLMLLCGCEAKTPTTDPVTDSQTVDQNDWNWFYWQAQMGTQSTITLKRTQDEKTQEVTLNYDGTSYIISDSDGHRTYRHLLHFPLKADENGQYFESFLLSDDPELTPDRYFSGDYSLPTELLFCHYPSFTPAETFGDCPAPIQRLTDLIAGSNSTFSKNSVFRFFYSAQAAPLLRRFDYSGNLIFETILKAAPDQILELEDGRAVVSTGSYSEKLELLTCYNQDGSVCWEYTLSTQDSIYLPYMLEQNGKLYCFGEITPEGCDSDLHFWCFTLDGELLLEKHISGNDFDNIRKVTKTKNGFMILGTTQSQDGDLSFSSNGNRVFFQLRVNESLEILSADPLPGYSSSYASECGYHHGELLYTDDSILSPTSSDRLPEDGVNVEGIFDWEGGYVILRTYGLGPYPYSHIAMSYQPQYRQLIATGYDENGTPLWQTVSEPFVN